MELAKRLFLAAAVPAMLGAGAVQAAPSWTSSPALTTRLAPVASEGGFQVRPPVGYTGPHKSSDQVVICRWNGPVQPDGHVMFLTFASLVQPPQMPKRALPQAFAGMMGVYSNHYTELKVTPTQLGVVRGILFCRCYWSGTDKETGRKMHGFQYAGQSGNVFYTVSAEGSASYSKSQFDLAEASALTFHVQ